MHELHAVRKHRPMGLPAPGPRPVQVEGRERVSEIRSPVSPGVMRVAAGGPKSLWRAFALLRLARFPPGAPGACCAAARR